MYNLRSIKLNIKLTIFFFFIFVVSGMISCSKKSDETGESYNAEMVDVDNNDFTETDEDLLNVDYKEFYDELAPHGEWIEVTDKDLGVEMKKGTSSGENSHRKISFTELFGVKDAHAYASFGAFFVWQPSPNLAVSMGVVEPEPQPYYVPYTNGQWVYTDAGWYFRAPTPYEEIVHHHGRWAYSPSVGWVWVPGRVWAPAWVEWREHTDYVAWTPLAPSVYLVNNVVVYPPIYPVYEDRYVIVERRYFVEPYIYKYKVKKGHFVINDWGRVGGVTVINNTVVNHGPNVSIIQNIRGGKIETVKIHKVKNKDNINYSSNEFDVYSPGFKKAKDKLNKTVTKPKDFARYDNANSKGKRDDIRGSGDNKRGNNENFKNDNKRKSGNSFNDKGKFKNDKSNDNSKNNKRNDNIKKKDGNKKQNYGEDKSKRKDNSKGRDNNSSNKKFRKENKNDGNKNKRNDGGKNKQKINDSKKQDGNSNSKSNNNSKGRNKKK